MRSPIRVLDLFCGAGGSSCGARQAGAEIIGAVDFWSAAAETFGLNFPEARRWCMPIQRLSGEAVARELGRVDLILASPECTNHTFAKGNRRVGEEQEASRRTAFEVLRFVRALQPRWVVVENVVSMRNWSEYPKWKTRLENLGYHIAETVLDSQRFGVAQTRRRLFIVGGREAMPPLPQPSRKKSPSVSQILQPNGTKDTFSYSMTPLYQASRPRAPATLDRAQRAISTLGTDSPFLIVYYGTDAAGGWQRIDRPLRTITTLDRFALVRPSPSGHVMRMLQPPELASAMGFPPNYQWPDVTRRERIKLIGNAVSPPVACAIVSALIARAEELPAR